MPIEHDSPVAARTVLDALRQRSGRLRQFAQVDVDFVDAAVFDLRGDGRDRRLEQARVVAIGCKIDRQQDRLLPFYTHRMRLNFDVKVYLDPSEELRYAWKVQRDTAKRGYTREEVMASLEKRQDLSPRYIHPQKRVADMIVRFYPPENNMQEIGGHLNAQVELKPTVPHPDLTDVLHHGSNGVNPELRLNLGRYEGTPADFMEIAGNLVEEKAHDLIELIQRHMPADCQLNEAMLGQYQLGLEAQRSLPLALTQHLIAYHMVTAGQTIDEMQS